MTERKQEPSQIPPSSFPIPLKRECRLPDLDGSADRTARRTSKGIANRLLLARGLRTDRSGHRPRGLHRTGRANPFITQLRHTRGAPIPEKRTASHCWKNSLPATTLIAVAMTHPYPGVRAALARLAETDRLGVCTNQTPYAPVLAVPPTPSSSMGSSRRCWAATACRFENPIHAHCWQPSRRWAPGPRSTLATAKPMPKRRRVAEVPFVLLQPAAIE